MSTERRSLFVTLAAQAMSSVGFSVSILALIWLTFVPPKPQPTEPILIDKKARRRSAPAALQARRPRSPSPSIRTTSRDDSSSLLASPQRTRRVYFVDSPTRPTTLVSRTSNDSSDILDKPSHALPVEISPSSSSSTLVYTYPAIPPQTLETCRESAIESDSSTSSARRSLSLTRPFQRTRRSSGTSIPELSPIITITAPASDKQQRRSSGGLIPTWSFRRASGSKSAAASTSSASPATIPPSSYFKRKSERRVSTPVPRTQPYAHPYYAQPPIEDEAYIAHLRGLPQFGAEVFAQSPTTSDSEGQQSPAVGRSRKLNDKAQAALGLGGRPPVQRPKQRSASESWAAGSEPRP